MNQAQILIRKRPILPVVSKLSGSLRLNSIFACLFIHELINDGHVCWHNFRRLLFNVIEAKVDLLFFCVPHILLYNDTFFLELHPKKEINDEITP